MKYDSDKLLFAVDLAGTLLFATEGATAAIAVNLDFLGLMVLAFSSALAGGIIRDLLIGAVPPSSLAIGATLLPLSRVGQSSSSCIVSYKGFRPRSS